MVFKPLKYVKKNSLNKQGGDTSSATMPIALIKTSCASLGAT